MKIASTDIPNVRSIKRLLTYIFGIGLTKYRFILNKVVYARCVHPQDREDNVELPIGADHNVDFFKEHFYLKDYKHHAKQRCKDPSGYAGLLPFSSVSNELTLSSVTPKTSSKHSQTYCSFYDNS